MYVVKNMHYMFLFYETFKIRSFKTGHFGILPLNTYKIRTEGHRAKPTMIEQLESFQKMYNMPYYIIKLLRFAASHLGLSKKF